MLYAASPAVVFAHAERLATLVEGTQCVKLIAQSIVDYGTNTVEHAFRIVTGYTAERIRVMHAACA
jgi:hypothetical protein